MQSFNKNFPTSSLIIPHHSYLKRKMPRGFTLIELLAVIVILAVIALIATPIITGIIADAKKSSLESETRMIASAITNYCLAQQALEKSCNDNGSFKVALLPSIISSDAGLTINTAATKLVYNETSSKLTALEVTRSGYIATWNDGTVTVTKSS